ncbi:MAG: adenylate/guanylate cyclase domain-containing protein, partial [Treponema sp.]|nr:adenylate/guanylate cyclase domain-containing protein [Treponema sp.]
MSKKKKIGKKLSAVIIASLVFAVITGLHLLGVFKFLEYKSYDLRVRLTAGYTRPSDEIIVILLQQDCLDWAQRERGWGWPWPRQAYAEIVNYMNLSGANAIAFDVIFSEPSVYRNARQDEIIDNAVMILEEAEAAEALSIEQPRGGAQGARQGGGSAPLGARQVNRAVINALRSLSAREDDAVFVRAEEDFGKVVQTVFFSTKTGSYRQWPRELDVPLFQPENFGNFLNRFDIGYEMGAEVGAQFPIQDLREAAGALGSVTGKPDSDGIIRRLKPFTYFDGKAVPGLGPALLMVTGAEQEIYYDNKSSSLQWEYYSIPVDKDGNALLRYRGELDRYQPYRAMDILLSAESVERGENLEFGEYLTGMNTRWNMLPRDNFARTYVFFGFYAPGLFDIFASPISSLYPGMGCHVTLLDNILKGDFIRESAQWLNLLILFAVVTVIVILTMFSHRIPVSLGGTAAIIIAILIGAFSAYSSGGLWIPMITLIAGTLAAFITVTLYNFATEGSQKRFIKSAFSQYLSPKVIDRIIADPSQLRLGGDTREMTAVFTDLRAFSTFSEALGDPAKLIELLNFYLTKTSNIVLDYEGTIDKYIGDAIVAFFGAPVYMDNHAALACRSAILMKKAEVDINREVLENGIINQKVLDALEGKGKLGRNLAGDPLPIFTRIGINTGSMVVGNMGTP